MREPTASGGALPELDPRCVEVWCAPLDVLDADLRGLRAVLDPTERERADRLRFPWHRDRFVTAHVVVRMILGRYLCIEPADVRLRAGPRGKPALDLPRGSHSLHFNLSHSDGLAVIAVSADRAVGVDVERIRAGFDYASIVDTFFSAGERAWLYGHDTDAREAAFFRAWTRKEALAKAAGTGLDGARDVASDAQGAQGARRWTVRSIGLAPAYAGAVAAEGAGWRAACHDWRPDLVRESAA